MSQDNQIILSSKVLLGQASSGAQPPNADDESGLRGYEPGDGIAFDFEQGALSPFNWLTLDITAAGKYLVVFEMALKERVSGRRFSYVYSVVNECSARLRMPMAAVNQNRWLYPREGALLKPMCYGDRVDPAKVDRIEITLYRKAPGPVDWTQTALTATVDEPEKLSDPKLPVGKLVDEFGQSTLLHWAQRTKSERELVDRLHSQFADASQQKFPKSYSRFGGNAAAKSEDTGFFRTHHDSNRWWLIDPDGYQFWSSGMDCVRPNIDSHVDGIRNALSWDPDPAGDFSEACRNGSVNYQVANLIRTFGRSWYRDWAKITIGQLRAWGFNTIANWSDTPIAALASFPYVRPLEFRPGRTPMIFRDFPDIYSDEFEKDAEIFAADLEETSSDPALIGYFLMNEPTWGFAAQCPALGMLYTNLPSKTRTKLIEFLRTKYTSDENLAGSWQTECSFKSLEGNAPSLINETALKDLEDFSSVMIDRYFGILSQACRKIDPNHLNLGARYYTIPPEWALNGMRHFDVFSVNCYDEVVNANLEQASARLNMPVMIGEWHFGALDVGLPATGIGHVKNQHERGRALRRYIEDAAAKPWCVGTHYFTLYDQSCLGRFDGENYNIGLVDVCNRPYQEVVDAVTETHNNLYAVASGEKPPFDEPIEYLPKLFM